MFAVQQAAKKSYGGKAVVYKATTCDLCESLKQEPNCVYACPHEAAHRALMRLYAAAGAMAHLKASVDSTLVATFDVAVSPGSWSSGQ